MSLYMFPQKARRTDDVIVEQQHQLAGCCQEPFVASDSLSAIGLIQDKQFATRMETAEKVGSAIGRPVIYHDEFVSFWRKILIEKCRKSSSQKLFAIESGD